MKKLLFVINDPLFFISHRIPIAVEAEKRGYIIHVASAYNKEAEKIITEKGFDFHHIELTRSGVNPFQELKTMIALYDLYKRLRPDIIHHVTIKPVLYGGIMAKAAKIPAVVSAIPGLGFIFISKRAFADVKRFFIKLIYKFALSHKNSKVIFQNPDDMKLFEEKRLIKKNRAVLILGSGIDISLFTPSPEPDSALPVITMASRMLWDKGVGEFVAAADHLKRKGISARFLLVGDIDPGNPTSVSKERLQEWHNKKIIEWLGFKKNMREIFADSHIVSLPSYREGLPKVLIEAASCGKPIITSDVPGCREIVEHGKNGLLVPPKDHIALADAIEKLIYNKTMRIQMGKYGRRLVESNFRIETVIEKTIEVYNDLTTSSCRI